MEVFDSLSCAASLCWCSFRRHNRRHSCRIRSIEQAASYAAGLCFPDRLDSFISPNGFCILSYSDFRTAKEYCSLCSSSLCIAAARQFPLADLFLSASALFILLFLAHFSVPSHLFKIAAVLPYCKDGCCSAAALSSLDAFRRLSQYRYLSAELIPFQFNNSVAYMLQHWQIMRNQHHCKLTLLLQPFKQMYNL